MRRAVVAILVSVLVTFGAGCGRVGPPASLEPLGVALPPASTSDVHALDTYADGATIHLLTAEAEAGAETPVLVHRRSDDGGATWSDPVRVDAGAPTPFRVHRGMDPQVAAAGDRIVAVWQTAGTGYMGSGPMATALSADGGRTWRPGPNPADDGTTSGHGFIDVAAGPDGAFHAVWLDERPDGPGGAPRRGLRHARSDDGGATWSSNATLDPETCECCWNSISVGAEGRLFVLYRDKDPRDMALAVSSDGGRTWTRASTVGRFDWAFDGCPHVGGGVAAAGGIVHAAVWTGRKGRVGAYRLSSDDGGASWSSPALIGDSTAHHVDLAAAGRSVAIVWDGRAASETEPSGRAIYGSISIDGGRIWTPPRRVSLPGANPTHPRVVAVPGGFRAFWTESWDGRGTVWATAVISGNR